MKTACTFLILMFICSNLAAQSTENYRVRNHKLNRKYLKNINSNKHQVAVYKNKESTENQSQSLLKKNHQISHSDDSKKLVMKNKTQDLASVKNSKFRDQNPTFDGTNNKHGKRFINYLTMMLAFSLILVSQ